jgi:hypothetical protein
MKLLRSWLRHLFAAQDFRVTRQDDGYLLEVDHGAGWRPDGVYRSLIEAARAGRRACGGE